MLLRAGARRTAGAPRAAPGGQRRGVREPERRAWYEGIPVVDQTGMAERSVMRNENMWRWNETWWQENEAEITVLYRKSAMREGFAGEEISLPRAKAEAALAQGIAVLPTRDSMEVLPCWNPETEQYDRLIQRTPQLLKEIARKRQWVDTYWRITDAYLVLMRNGVGWDRQLASPLTREDIARALWQQAQVRINPAWISFRYTSPGGVYDMGHTWVWVRLPGGDDIASPRLVYDNKKAKLRLQIQYSHKVPY